MARERPRYLFAWDCGTGKTIGMLATIVSRPMKTVVVAPKAVATTAWINDAKHFPSLSLKILRAEDPGRSGIVYGTWDVLVTNFEMFKKYSRDLLNVGVRRLVVDESSKLKDHKTAITREAIAFSDKMAEVYLLSGTPAPNSWTEYWGQMRCVVGPTIRPFHDWSDKCGYPVREHVRVKGQDRTIIRRWEQTPEQARVFKIAIGKHSWSLSKTECLDLPAQLDRVIDVELSDEETRAYESAVARLRVDLAGGRIGHIRGEAALTKLRQIVGGAVYFDGEVHALGECAKLDALGEVCNEIGLTTPLVVWFQYRHEHDRLVKFFAGRGEPCASIDSENAREVAEKFQRGEIPRLLCQPQSVGHGVTLHRASHAAYFALDFSYELWKQSRDRIHRAGMGDAPATYHVLRATLPAGVKTVDHAMLRTIQGKKRDSDGILDALRDLGIGVAQEVGAR